MAFKAGFVNIVGKPNTGKSTLMNVLVGDKLSIITPKAQTTRRRILGIVTQKNYQVVFSDTPGLIDAPEYKLHKWMNEQVQIALSDADILLLMITPYDKYEENDPFIQQIKKLKTPVILLINKSDTLKKHDVESQIKKWKEILPGKKIIAISALNKTNISELLDTVHSLLPEHPPYFEADEITDQTERFIAAEIVREKIFLFYKQEIPYSVEVIVSEYKDKGTIIVIKATIFVSKESHKSIIIGKGGTALKKTGVAAREDIEAFTGRKVFLELFVKVKENWKNEQRDLKYFGYQ